MKLLTMKLLTMKKFFVIIKNRDFSSKSKVRDLRNSLKEKFKNPFLPYWQNQSFLKQVPINLKVFYPFNVVYPHFSCKSLADVSEKFNNVALPTFFNSEAKNFFFCSKDPFNSDYFKLVLKNKAADVNQTNLILPLLGF